VQDWLAKNGYQLMLNQGVGADGSADKYQNLAWMQDAQGNMIGDPTYNRDDPNGVMKAIALAAGGYFKLPGGELAVILVGWMAIWALLARDRDYEPNYAKAAG
jgi:hypothetical protein